jgi:hypothetical protein
MENKKGKLMDSGLGRSHRNLFRLGVSFACAGFVGLTSAQTTSPAPFEAACVILPLDGRGVNVGPFVTTQGTTAPQRTTAVLQADPTALTVMVTCADTNILCGELGRDQDDLWKDDNVEIFIDPQHAHDLDGDWRHVLLTAKGQVMDESGPARGYFDSGMTMGGHTRYDVEGLQVKTETTPAGWMARLVIPWASFGVTPLPGTIVGFNLNRTDPPDGYFCLFPTRGVFLLPDRWGHLILTDPQVSQEAAQTSATDRIAALHRQILDQRANTETERNRFLPAHIEVNTPSVMVGNVRYGAEADDRGPIGGGAGYTQPFTRGDFEPRSLPELIKALKSAQTGQVVFLAGDVEIDTTARWFTDKLVLEIPPGVTLAGDRGLHGSPGALISCDAYDIRPLIRALGSDVTITGLRLRGPDPKINQEHHDRMLGGPGDNREKEKRAKYYALPTSDGVQTEHDRLTVANCEISAWSHGGIYLMKGIGHHIHHNYIHHNRRQGLGYGVSIDVAQALIERNLFEYNRHDIAGTGRAGSGYEACHNVVLSHESVGHQFDMHGGSDRRDGTDLASDFLKIHHNAFYGSGRPIKIRGTPSGEAVIYRNWFPRHRPPLTPDELLKLGLPTSVYSHGNTRVFDNAYGLIMVK